MAAILALVAALAAAEPVLSYVEGPEPQIDLHTMGQGEVLYQRFGHAALCVVYDSQPKRNRCYNYGVTDFTSPPENMGWGFLRGTANFWVNVKSERWMIARYTRMDRTLWRQRLPLTPEQVQVVVDKLAFDALEENKYYAYQHFSDNCTTRVRDIIDDAVGGALSRDNDEPVGITYRELGRRGLADQTVMVVVAHFLFGRVADVEPTRWEAMFLPSYLREDVASRLGAPAEVVYQRAQPLLSTEGSSGKGWILLIALVVAVPLLVTRFAGRFEGTGRWMTAVLLTLFGAVIWFVVLAAGIPELRWNEAALVFWPSDFLLALFGEARRKRYALVRVLALLVVSFALAVGIFRQPLFVPLLIPLVPMAATLAPKWAGRSS